MLKGLARGSHKGEGKERELERFALSDCKRRREGSFSSFIFFESDLVGKRKGREEKRSKGGVLLFL